MGGSDRERQRVGSRLPEGTILPFKLVVTETSPPVLPLDLRPFCLFCPVSTSSSGVPPRSSPSLLSVGSRYVSESGRTRPLSLLPSLGLYVLSWVLGVFVSESPVREKYSGRRSGRDPCSPRTRVADDLTRGKEKNFPIQRTTNSEI